MGGLRALETALRTDRLRGLVLYEPAFPVGGDEVTPEDVLAEMERSLEAGENERVLELMFEGVAGLTPAQMDAIRSAPNWPARVAAAQTVIREARAENEDEFDPTRFLDTTTPTVLLSGSESPRAIRDMTDAVDEALPNSRVVVLEGQGHVAMTTAPALFVDDRDVASVSGGRRVLRPVRTDL